MNLFINDFVLISRLSLKSFSNGLIISFFILFLIGSFAYCIFMYIKKWMIPTLTAVAAFVIFPILNNDVFHNYETIFSGIIDFQTPIVLCLKIVLISLILHILAYIPFKFMEVEK